MSAPRSRARHARRDEYRQGIIIATGLVGVMRWRRKASSKAACRLAISCWSFLSGAALRPAQPARHVYRNIKQSLTDLEACSGYCGLPEVADAPNAKPLLVTRGEIDRSGFLRL